MLTGNRDTDVSILLSLSLKDVRHFCSTNKSIYDLCFHEVKRKIRQCKEKVNKAIQFLMTQRKINNDYRLPLAPIEISAMPIHQLFKFVRIINLDERDSYYVEGDLDYLKDERTYELYIGYYKKGIYNIYLNQEIYQGSIEQIKEALLHLIYNNMIFTF